MAAKARLTLKLSAKDEREANRLRKAVSDAVNIAANAQIRANLLINQYTDFVHERLKFTTSK